MSNNLYKIKLNKYKLKNLYSNILKVLGLKNRIASILNISTKTLDEYISLSNEYIETYDSMLEEMFEIDTSHIDDKHDSNREELQQEYLEKNGMQSVGDKYKHLFDSFIFRKREEEKHKYMYYLEQEFLDNITLSENEDEDKKIKILILFKRIWDRAQLTLDSELCATVDRHSKSSKNVGLAFKLLEKRNREDLSDNQQKHSGEINVNHNITSFAELANMIQRQRREMIEQKDENIIDIEYEEIEKDD